MKLLLILIISMSITNIVTQEYIFEPIRNLWCKIFSKHEKIQYLITCPICSGFWIGLFCGLLFFFGQWLNVAFMAFGTSFAMKIVDNVLFNH